ncbi:OmpH family outer membrane protein [Alkaliflexus imshenetskii]|uniref:OmpH family outer membrane protein n=1 Tax=Alkaliflexus imshenetskii TaxID=286730 RepID=UPI00047E1BC4|nr:OmpH family outer membrane protein [Alkaliflexus imshenetskii]
MRIGNFIRITLIAVILSVPLTAMTQEVKFGHISLADVVLLMPEYQNISKVLESETSVLERQFNSMREELQKIEIDYENNFDKYTQEQKNAKEQEYVAMQQRVQEFFVNAQQTLQRRQEELQVPVLEKLNQAIDAVGLEHGFLYIFESNSGLTLYQSSKSVDVTPLVKTKLGI